MAQRSKRSIVAVALLLGGLLASLPLGSKISLMVDVAIEDLEKLASDPSCASEWIKNFILDFPDVSFRHEITGPDVNHILPAVENIYNALSLAGLNNQIKVSTVIQFGVVGTSYPPSAGAFLNDTLEKASRENVPVVVTETGWPSDGGLDASVANAKTYIENLIQNVKTGTPNRPGLLETYIFAMFNENQKPPGVEQYWGLFRPNESPVYSVNFDGN
ncbi:hypothetical protein LUZ63_008880 [Rhynchospora breviuscula]|uniref:Uncharacterized protein n=1 Tax=Rhynchospora breviuscula TaxID=2022672 RepID=A0A9Q0CEC4_9POAL|nr:hypothetical protein LUZ63_008880 [Rhynchospora breviuscula]